jgi:hypothetical protein
MFKHQTYNNREGKGYVQQGRKPKNDQGGNVGQLQSEPAKPIESKENDKGQGTTTDARGQCFYG